MAVKANDHQAGGDTPIGQHVVELVGLVEQDVPLFKRQLPVPCNRNDLAPVHADQLPEIMAFPWKGKVAHILEIVDGYDIFYGDAVLQVHTFICHKSFPLLIGFTLVPLILLYHTNIPCKER